MLIMTIKEECDSLYKIIKESQDRLDKIRKTCPHKEFVIGYYEWRTGAGCNGFICTDCGKFLKAT